MKTTTSDFQTMDYERTLKQEENQGFTGVWGRGFLFFLEILYIFFWRGSLLNVFLFCFYFYFLKVLLRGVLRREKKQKKKQNEGRSQRSNCRKKQNKTNPSQSCSVFLSLLKVHVIVSVRASACLCAYIEV